MAGRLRSGALRAEEALEAFVAKAVEVNRRTNAVTEFLDDASEAARRLDALPSGQRGPLHGVPVSLKEHLHLSGRDATVGVPRYVDVPRERDAALVSMLRYNDGGDGDDGDVDNDDDDDGDNDDNDHGDDQMIVMIMMMMGS